MSINSVSCGRWLLLQLLTSKLTVVNMKVPLHLCRTTSSWISPTDDGFCTHIASPLFLCLRHLIINKFHQRLEKGTCLRLTATDKFYISRFLSHVYVKYRTLQKSWDAHSFFIFRFQGVIFSFRFFKVLNSSSPTFLRIFQRFSLVAFLVLAPEHFLKNVFLSDASGPSGDPSAVTKSRKVPVEGWLSRSHF